MKDRFLMIELDSKTRTAKFTKKDASYSYGFKVYARSKEHYEGLRNRVNNYWPQCLHKY